MRLDTFPWCRVYNKSLGLTGKKVHSWIVEQLNWTHTQPQRTKPRVLVLIGSAFCPAELEERGRGDIFMAWRKFSRTSRTHCSSRGFYSWARYCQFQLLVSQTVVITRIIQGMQGQYSRVTRASLLSGHFQSSFLGSLYNFTDHSLDHSNTLLCSATELAI